MKRLAMLCAASAAVLGSAVLGSAVFGSALLGGAFEASAHMSKAPGTIDRLRAGGGAFVIGYREDAAPFAYQQAGAEGAAAAQGYSVDLCRAIGEAVKAEVGQDGGPAIDVAYEPVTAATRFAKLREGEIDILCGPTTLTLARQQEFDFSFLTFLTQGVLIFKNDREVDNVFGATVGAIENSTSLDLLKRSLDAEAAANTTIVEFASHDDGLAAIQSGAIDSYFGDRSILIQYAVEDESLTLATGLSPIEQYALPMRGGDRNLRLIANRTLAELYRTGAIEPIFKEAFPGARMADSLAFLYTTFSIVDGQPPE